MRLLMLLMLTLPPCCAPAPGARVGSNERSSTSSDTLPLAFTDDQGLVYDALLTIPAPAHWNRHAVLLLGGGSVTDMHWTVPGTVDDQGHTIPLTTTGAPTRDADTIAAALVASGFGVMQYSSIHRGDPLAAENPALATYVPYAKSRDIALAALATLRARPGIDPDAVALVGHSLGAARALQIAATDPAISALVLLAPAYASRLGVPPSRAAGESIDALREQGLDADAGIPRHVFNARRSRLPAPLDRTNFDALDRDDDETLRRWEIASALILARLDAGNSSDLTDAPDLNGAPFPADVLVHEFPAPVPTLAIFAGLDTMTVHAPFLERAGAARAEAGLPTLDVVIVPHLGHNLGPVRPREDPDLVPLAGPNVTGPIDPAIPDLIARWLIGHLERTDFH